MKVLLVYPDKNPNDNPFIRTLMKGLKDLGCDINWGRNEFWKNYANYAIIHFHWPDAMFEKMPPSDADVIQLEEHLHKLKKFCKLIYTRHNKEPHYTQNANRLKCYRLIEQHADAIVHLGHYEIELYKRQLMNDHIQHFFIPHHTYDTIYNNTITKENARTFLNIPQNKFVILTFGDYRDQEEANMVLSAFRNLPIKNKYLLAPRIISALTKQVPNKYRMNWFISKVVSRWLKQYKVHGGNNYVTDTALENYFSAADVVVIQRKQILNSGNVSLAFFFRKLVVGPDIGNVGLLLKQTNNIVFDPDQNGSLCEALKHAQQTVNSTTIGQNNWDYATKHMLTKIVAQQYFDVYKKIR